jgi:hypothetical protein
MQNATSKFRTEPNGTYYTKDESISASWPRANSIMGIYTQKTAQPTKKHFEVAHGEVFRGVLLKNHLALRITVQCSYLFHIII